MVVCRLAAGCTMRVECNWGGDARGRPPRPVAGAEVGEHDEVACVSWVVGERGGIAGVGA